MTENLSNIRWRLDNLYWIVDFEGNKVLFKMNESQEDLFNNFHYLNVIPKARQLGFSTFIDILILDACLFNPNVTAGIIAHTRDDAEEIFRTKTKFPFENLPSWLKAKLKPQTDSARTLKFANGSQIRVGTSMRSGTLQYLHISEFGKICAKYPEKANEIVSGSLNTIHPGSFIFIESTAEGAGGYFYDYTQNALQNQLQKKTLTELDYKLHFYPWWGHSNYKLKDDELIIPDSLEEYFETLEHQEGIPLTLDQKKWYTIKKSQQKEFIYREFPSTLREAFLVSNEGFYYEKEFNHIYKENRICAVPHSRDLTVDTIWDIGIRDTTAIWFVQPGQKDFRVIDYYENNSEGLAHYVAVLHKRRDDLGYNYGNHWFPHDIEVRELGTGKSRIEVLRKLGMDPQVVPKLQIEDGIEAARNILPMCWFDEKKCEKGIKGLKQYKKQWDDRMSCYKNKPLHNWASNPADAFRYFAIIADRVGDVDTMTAEEAQMLFRKHRSTV